MSAPKWTPGPWTVHEARDVPPTIKNDSLRVAKVIGDLEPDVREFAARVAAAKGGTTP